VRGVGIAPASHRKLLRFMHPSLLHHLQSEQLRQGHPRIEGATTSGSQYRIKHFRRANAPPTQIATAGPRITTSSRYRNLRPRLRFACDWDHRAGVLHGAILKNSDYHHNLFQTSLWVHDCMVPLMCYRTRSRGHA
jgi:hypothetical protein